MRELPHKCYFTEAHTFGAKGRGSNSLIITGLRRGSAAISPTFLLFFPTFNILLFLLMLYLFRFPSFLLTPQPQWLGPCKHVPAQYITVHTCSRKHISSTSLTSSSETSHLPVYMQKTSKLQFSTGLRDSL